MNTQRISAVILVAGLAALVVWWRWPATAPVAPVLTPPTAVANENDAPPPATPPAPPPAPPPMVEEPPPAPVVAAEEAPPAPPAFDPQADLSTAVPDFIRLMQSGNYATLLQTYLPPHPGLTDEQWATIWQPMQAEMQKPEAQQQLQQLISAMQFIQNSPPIISHNGDYAIYTLPAGSKPPSVIFNKVNGRWYNAGNLGVFLSN